MPLDKRPHGWSMEWSRGNDDLAELNPASNPWQTPPATQRETGRMRVTILSSCDCDEKHKVGTPGGGDGGTKKPDPKLPAGPQGAITPKPVTPPSGPISPGGFPPPSEPGESGRVEPGSGGKQNTSPAGANPTSPSGSTSGDGTTDVVECTGNRVFEATVRIWGNSDQARATIFGDGRRDPRLGSEFGVFGGPPLIMKRGWVERAKAQIKRFQTKGSGGNRYLEESVPLGGVPCSAGLLSGEISIYRALTPGEKEQVRAARAGDPEIPDYEAEIQVIIEYSFQVSDCGVPKLLKLGASYPPGNTTLMDIIQHNDRYARFRQHTGEGLLHPIGGEPNDETRPPEGWQPAFPATPGGQPVPYSPPKPAAAGQPAPGSGR